jgi:C-terminal processing protease CtpA/Prc
VRRSVWLLFLVAACGGSPAPRPVTERAPAAGSAALPPGVPQASPAEQAAADAIAKTYERLTVESAIPGDPAQLRAAAIDALAPKGWPAAPIAWSGTPKRDAELLRHAALVLALRHELPADAVVRAAQAMVAAAHDASTFVLDKPALDALFALIDGGPVVQPGMLYHQLPDQRWAVSEVFPGGPAAAAGVLPGDILVSLDGTPITRGYVDLTPLLGAKPGTIGKLVVERDGTNRELDLRMAPVATPILAIRVLPGAVGYLRLRACTHSDDPQRDAAKLVAAALAQFDKRHVKKLVLDLRGNPGGYPFDLASLLVDATPLMLAVGTGGVEQPVPRTTVAPWKTKRPIAVIVDDGTAAGAEMIAFVLREHAGATIVGRPTAGGLSFPTAERVAGELMISYPLSRVGSVKTKQVLPGDRLAPDVAVDDPTPADYAAGKDPQLAAAIAALK